MKYIIDDSLRELGIHEIVVATVTGVDGKANLTPELEVQIEKAEQRVMANDNLGLENNQILKGYRELVRKINRSLKKNPPTTEALIKNIQRRGFFPRINSIVDVYNLEALNSYLSIGAHDLSKVSFPLEFTVSKKEDVFFPIMSSAKKVAAYDYLYRDQKGILAYLDCRDSELYKISEDTQELLLIIVGNEYTSTAYRVAALETIIANLKTCMPKVTARIELIR